MHYQCWRRSIGSVLLAWVVTLVYLLGLWGKSMENEQLLSRQLAQANDDLLRLRIDSNRCKCVEDFVRREKDQIQNTRKHQSSGDNNAILSLGDANSEYLRVKGKGNTEHSEALVKLKNSPTPKYELVRRKIFRDINEMWWYVRGKLENGLRTNDNKLRILFNRTLIETQHRYCSLLADLNELSAVDGFKYWREGEAKKLGSLVQKRLRGLQNPKSCSGAQKLICKLNQGCGFGCQIHHAVYCFIVAYGTERMLILKDFINIHGFSYNERGFEEVFKPLSKSCAMISNISFSSTPWPGKNDSQVVEIVIPHNGKIRSQFIPPAIPEEMADRLIRLHANPTLWWVSQFVRYILRPQDETAKLLKAAEMGRDTSKPMVGIHIRRTDKMKTEAAFHEVDEYMKYVNEYFKLLEVNGNNNRSTKQVYLASDDPNVFSECRSKFPEYKFLGDQSIAKASRYNLNSLRGVIIDIHMLSLSDFIVCTFSSNICRLAYELQQTRYVDGSWRFKSLDDIWYFSGQSEHQQEVEMPHLANGVDEINLNVGDVINILGNHWNGCNKGINHANKEMGLYPEYKTKEKIKIVAFPTYPHVKL